MYGEMIGSRGTVRHIESDMTGPVQEALTGPSPLKENSRNDACEAEREQKKKKFANKPMVLLLPSDKLAAVSLAAAARFIWPQSQTYLPRNFHRGQAEG